jgi:hypothetical protein
MDLGVRQRTRFFVGMALVLSVCENIAYGLMDGRLNFWQYCINTVAGIHITLMPAFWYLMCCGLARAAKCLGDEVEQVWEYIVTYKVFSVTNNNRFIGHYKS